MKTDSVQFSLPVRVITVATCGALAAGCATGPAAREAPDIAAAHALREARSIHFTTEARVAHYLDAASLTVSRLGSGTEPTPPREIYNAAAAELTITLRSEDRGRLWNRPLTLTGEQRTYHLRLQSATPNVWSPDYFNSFEDAGKVETKMIKRRSENIQPGVGGALVGIRITSPRENFAPARGIAAPVTATLDFEGNDATLALRRPAEDSKAKVQGAIRPLVADFSAPIGYYQPPANLPLLGLMAGLRSSHYIDKTGLYFLQPYDPDRIPLVFVHGLFSTPFTWVEAINGLQSDREIRKHYQFWVFAYQTGNPILYSAFRLREELAKVDKHYPNHLPYVVVGHSMGGMLTQLQVVTITPAMWEKALGETAKNIFRQNSSDSLIVRATSFQANPRIKRVVFICTPHRGSDMASGGAGRFVTSLINLPITLAQTMKNSLTDEDRVRLTGTSKRLPNSVWGLKPSNPGLPVINAAPITVPYHSIIGDRGKGDSPNSTDGVVAYWSSHFDGAQSELIVPGPHGSCGLPQTVAELKRILHLHLRASGRHS